MLRKNNFTSLLLVALFLASGITVLGQSTTVGGKIVMKKEDGSKAPAKDVVVELIRIDEVSKLPETKTDAEGAFSFTNVPKDGVFAMSISGAGLKPEIIPDIKAGMDSFEIPVTAGDGKRWSEQQVRLSILVSIKETGKLTDEQKKMLEDYENTAGKTKEKNDLWDKHLKEGNEALKSKNYDAAIASYESGYQVDTEYLGSAPVFLNQKADALKGRAVLAYNTAAKTKDGNEINKAKEQVVKDFSEALVALNTSHGMMVNAKPTEIINQENHKKNIKIAENVARELVQIMSKISVTLATYIADEKDAANSVKIYKDTLKMLPDDPDVLAGLGLTLYISSEFMGSKEQKQESLNYMDVYKKVAPKDHKQQEAVAELYDVLTKIEKLKPQKMN
jgi:tetratricopeptide (TPR) repeat protein